MSVHLEKLREMLGTHAVSDDPSMLEIYGCDRTRETKPRPSLVVFPRTTDHVISIMRYCSDHRIGIVPSGGRTGYAGAAVAAHGEVVVSMEKMNRIISVNVEDGCVDVESGAILQHVQEAVAGQGMLLPIDFSSRGSCQIGGCISTNAGGIRVMRYGMTRESVMGLEVITPTGQLLDLHDRLHKNNSGYDLKQLFIGAEGTLGIITKATLRIVNRPHSVQVALLALNHVEEVVRVLDNVRRQSSEILAFEFFDKPSLEAVLSHGSNFRRPFQEIYSGYAVLECDEDPSRFGAMIEAMVETGMIADALIADSTSESARLWAYREAISESLSARGRVHKNDVAVPVSALPAFMSDLTKILQPAGAEIILFGHIGDGNVHVNIVDRQDSSAGAFQSMAADMDREMCQLVGRYRGSISAEHGIGLLKKHLLAFQRSPEQIDLMRQLKRMLDPNGICNPGKILD